MKVPVIKNSAAITDLADRGAIEHPLQGASQTCGVLLHKGGRVSLNVASGAARPENGAVRSGVMSLVTFSRGAAPISMKTAR